MPGGGNAPIPAGQAEGADSASVEAASTPDQAGDAQAAYYGVWTVKEHRAAQVSALSSEQMQAYVGRTVDYGADAVLINGGEMNVTGPVYECEPYTAEALAEEYRVDLGQWQDGVSELIAVSVASGEDCFGNRFFAAGEDRIWIYYEGAFFLAERS